VSCADPLCFDRHSCQRKSRTASSGLSETELELHAVCTREETPFLPKVRTVFPGSNGYDPSGLVQYLASLRDGYGNEITLCRKTSLEEPTYPDSRFTVARAILYLLPRGTPRYLSKSVLILFFIWS